MDRETKKLKLPMSGNTAVVVTYFLRGDTIYFERALTEGLTLDPNTMKPTNFSTDRMHDQVKRVFERGVMEIQDKEGKKLEGDINDLINDLPDDDVDIIDEYLNELRTKKKKPVEQKTQSTTT